MTPSFDQEIARRRTFAIISHPDAGKTTLTEKLLLYGGALQLAGSRDGAAASSGLPPRTGWNSSASAAFPSRSTVLQFDYAGYRVNLLDTPGHQDFSEDTYRVLTAVDAAIMVIDAGKGIEAQTRKLFEVCKRRGVPIFTFMNKLDRPAREPIDLLDELGERAGHGDLPDELPARTGAGFPGGVRPFRQAGASLRANGRRGVSCAVGNQRPGLARSARTTGRGHLPQDEGRNRDAGNGWGGV